MDDEARMSTLREEISTRLRGICSDMPEDEFAILVDGIARNTRKFEKKLILGRLRL